MAGHPIRVKLPWGSLDRYVLALHIFYSIVFCSLAFLSSYRFQSSSKSALFSEVMYFALLPPSSARISYESLWLSILNLFYYIIYFYFCIQYHFVSLTAVSFSLSSFYYPQIFCSLLCNYYDYFSCIYQRWSNYGFIIPHITAFTY